MKKFSVTLASIGNPDHNQDPTRSLYGVDDKIAMVDTLEDASTACREFIDDNELGGGNWYGGTVYDNEEKRIVAYISYNGRVWTDPKDWPPYVRESAKSMSEQTKAAENFQGTKVRIDYEVLTDSIYRGLKGMHKNDMMALLVAKGLVSTDAPEAWDFELTKYLNELSASIITSIKDSFPQLALYLDGQEILKRD